MGRKIGIFGGTFDPVHLGHVAIVVALTEAHGLDEVLIIPTHVNPHKNHTLPTAAKHRFRMCKKAFADLPYVKILSLELERDAPSFTIDTVRELHKQKIVAENDTLFLLLGQDVLQNFSKWKCAEELIGRAMPLVARRTGFKLPASNSPLQKSLKKGMTNTPCYDISATEVRKRLKRGLYCGHMLDKLVYNYIKRHKLYE